MNYIILLISSFLGIQSGSIHDLHLSRTDLAFNPSSNSFEVTIHLFIDDLEYALAEDGFDNLMLCTDKEDVEADTYISYYLSEHLKILVDNNQVNMTYLGKEESDDLQAVWCYIEIPLKEQPEMVTVELDFFNELYEDQKNILQINFDETNKGYFLLNSQKTSGSINIR